MSGISPFELPISLFAAVPNFRFFNKASLKLVCNITKLPLSITLYRYYQ